MSREVHVRFREGAGVRLPRATRLAVFCPTQEEASEAKERLSQWLRTRGLQLSEAKTHIRHLTEGFNFLGFNIRHYPAPQSSRSGYLGYVDGLSRVLGDGYARF
jgi:hypothetical protein